MTDVRNKRVLITGGGMGMGALLAAKLAANGAKLVLIDLNEQALSETAEKLKKTGAQIFHYLCDITDYAAVAELAEKVRKQAGPVDILVNNAGVAFPGKFLDMPIEKHHKIIDVNVNGVLNVTYAFLPEMLKLDSAHIVNMASAAGLMGVAGITSYSTSKFAVVGFTETLYYELQAMGHDHIELTAVCPSFVNTGMFAGAKPPMLSPWVSPEKMVDKIFNGIIKNKPMVKAPAMVHLVPFLKAFLPRKWYSVIAKFLGVSTAMDDWSGRD